MNLAMAEIKLENWASAKKAAAAAVAIEPTNVKALFRRGMALARSGSFEEATVDLNKCLVSFKANNLVVTKGCGSGIRRRLHRFLLQLLNESLPAPFALQLCILSSLSTRELMPPVQIILARQFCFQLHSNPDIIIGSL